PTSLMASPHATGVPRRMTGGFAMSGRRGLCRFAPGGAEGGGLPATVPACDAVELELAIERLPVEPEHRRGGRLVALRRAQRLDDLFALDVGHRSHGLVVGQR